MPREPGRVSDGTTLALLAQRARQTQSRLDGDGHAVPVRFIRGSGPLSWQPLPATS